MSTNNNKKKNLLKTLSKANVICRGCGCDKPKLSDVHEPTPKPKQTSHNLMPSSATAATSAIMDDQDYTKVDSPCPKIVDSFAVVKDSNDPYEDFRHSMLQMIMEKEINANDDLKELLNCFLELNSPLHHDVIVQAFNGIRNEVISKRPDSLTQNL